MRKLRLDLEYCYGINELKTEFDFSNSNTVAIYAPNGVMKTSLANTFSDISQGQSPKERLFGNTPRFQILSDNAPITKDKILVIKSFENKYDSEKSITTLLVDEDSKTEYDEIYTDILKKKDSLINKLNRASGVAKKELEKILLSDFNKTDFFDFITKISLEDFETDFADIKYSEIFDKDVLEFLKNPEVIKNIRDYIEKYNTLIQNSKYFKKGVFNPAKADNVANTLKKENFFKAEHAIKLAGDDSTITDDDVLTTRLREERKEILENEELKKIESEIKKVSVQRFREILELHPILPELQNLNAFRIKLWKAYLKKEETTITDLIEIFADGKQKLEEIENRAQTQKTQWDIVVNKFKTRFYVPFEVSIQNKSNAILGKTAPNIVFDFKENNTGKHKELKREELEKVELLSQGEKRAFYLLNVMFNVEAKIKDEKDTLFLIDDIADSFDYKNKYAIVQYLKDISEISYFNQVILTHNFDFFRTIESRKIVKYSNCYYSFKERDKIVLEKAKWIKNPFIGDWKNNLSDTKKFIASIPFIRNIIEYTNGEADLGYLKLTSVLHWKSDTLSILCSDLESVFTSTIPNIIFPSNIPTSSKIVDILFREADNCLIAPEGINLENKIVLSVAIRLKAEEYMWSKVSDKSVISGSQTGKLFERFKSEFSCSMDEEIEKLEEVCLMTPENIHLNSFMYEPILDMSDFHLRELYKSIKELS
ncbi:MAG TPA: hypothetical protein VK982_13715 [Bacteroidales bacterium]|nr:hypothetical protein [Bacteroidales bacterium]